MFLNVSDVDGTRKLLNTEHVLFVERNHDGTAIFRMADGSIIYTQQAFDNILARIPNN